MILFMGTLSVNCQQGFHFRVMNFLTQSGAEMLRETGPLHRPAHTDRFEW